jgi:hypothetical protein
MSVNNLKTFSGKRVADVKKIKPIPKQKVTAKPKTFLILAKSFNPQNCDIKADAPLENPKRTPQWMKNS